MDNRILDMVSSPADLKLLTNEELSILAQEVREEIVTTASQTGGHVASSLGAVEIILALHSMLDCPHDKIVFDVGHQAYAHKLITGRSMISARCAPMAACPGFRSPTRAPTTCIRRVMRPTRCRWRSVWRSARTLGRRREDRGRHRRRGSVGWYGVRGAQPHRPGADAHGDHPQR